MTDATNWIAPRLRRIAERKRQEASNLLDEAHTAEAAAAELEAQTMT